MGRITYRYKYPKSLLNKGTGFLSGYSHTLNPYMGCAFSCSYCYVRKMPVALFRNETWGTWVEIKQDAKTVFQKELQRAKANGPVTIFMSSSTDPYQPIEYKERITRSLLEVMVDHPPDFLFIQTRSPLVQRDIDLFLKLGQNIRVSVTVETDREDIRKHFTPQAPPISARLKTLQILREAGVPVQATIAPILPCSDQFANRLRLIVERVCIDDYFMGDGSGGKRTMSLNIKSLYTKLGLEEWYHPLAYLKVYDQLLTTFPEHMIHFSQKGFEPDTTGRE